MIEDFTTITLITLIAFLSPLVAEKIKVPAVVIEILLGALLGVSVLNIISHSEWLSFLALLGLIFLMFLSGLEIDLGVVIGDKSVLRLTVVYLLLSFSTAVVAVKLLNLDFIYAILLTNVAVGLVISTLRELKLESTTYGQMNVIVAFITDVSTMFLLSLYFLSGVVQILFALMIVLAFFVAYYVGRLVIWHFPNFVSRWFTDEPMEIGVRGSLAIMMFFVGLSHLLGVEAILGAFLAGVLISIVFRGGKKLYDKLYGIGYGFLIPIFFVKTGADFRFTLDEKTVANVLLLLFISYVVKIIPSLLFARRMGLRNSIAFGVLQSSKLSLTIAGVTIGVTAGVITENEATSLITFTIIACLVSPTLFRWIYRNSSA